ncbi:MAG: glutamate racemase [Chloroflexi bacterium]|nr:glutamate racemase [Chloroflexota bacterium]
MATPDPRPIGLLDSGVGGLSILNEVRQQLPNEDVLYFADQRHVPYGPRPKEQIRSFSRAIAEFLLGQGAKAIVLACNAASAASLYHLRETFPDTPFVGMEPAVKPAALNTQTGTIGVLTTRVTYQGELFASVVDRFAAGVEVAAAICPEFVTLVEAGQLDSLETKSIVRRHIEPLLAAGADQLVLGCTHFPFLAPIIQEISGPTVTIVDPSPAVARQTGRVIAEQRNHPDHRGRVTYFTSGSVDSFFNVAQHLLLEAISVERVKSVHWDASQRVEFHHTIDA